MDTTRKPNRKDDVDRWGLPRTRGDRPQQGIAFRQSGTLRNPKEPRLEDNRPIGRQRRRTFA